MGAQEFTRASAIAKVELVTVERIGNQKHYQANRASPVFAELHGLIVRTSGLVAPLRAALAPLADRVIGSVEELLAR